MGCIASKDQQYDLKYKHDAQPTDTVHLNPSDFPQVNFQALLTKLKLKRCTFYKHVGIKISFGRHHDFELKPKFIFNQTARWDVYHQFQFKATEYDLRRQFMQLTFVDQKAMVIGNLKINLYLLATGPYHQDFSIQLAKSDGARISFNLKIAQEVGIRLQINQAQMIPSDKEFPGDIFAFSLCSIMKDRIEESDLSYKYLVGFKQNQTEGLIQQKAPRKIARKQTIEDRPVYSHLVKIKKDGNKNEEEVKIYTAKDISSKKIWWSISNTPQMPIFENMVPLFDLHGASFNIIFYSFSTKVKAFSSECFISFNKLTNYQFQQKKDPQTKKIYEERLIQIQAKTWDHGKETGIAKFNITFILQKHLKQMQLCVRTERGVLESSPVFGQSGGSSKIPQELVQLERLANQIQNQFVQVSSSTSQYKNLMWVNQVNKRLLRQREILMSSSKESMIMFVYHDENSLLKGQRGLIELGKRIRSLLDQDRQQITPNCWELLINLIKRGELNLAHMGFSQQQIQLCQAAKATEFIKRKIQVSLSYYNLLVDLLDRTFKSLQAYNYQRQRQFAELFCAYAYFRLPKFRSQVLSVITRANDPQIQEWRGTQYSLKELPGESQPQQTAFGLMFDWQNRFYKVLLTEQEYNKTEAKLMQLLRTNSWEERMKKRGGAFFAFVKYWGNYVENIAVNSKHINWRYFPGYNKILLSFMAQMKSKPITDYSDVMKNAATSLLSNQKLLNPFVLIIFRKTNQHDQPTVIKCFDLISNFLQSIKSRGRTLPTTFDLKLLFKGIKSILQGQASYSIGKVLILIYDNYKIFPVDFRIEICNFLLTKVFFKLFLHWSQNVRTIFHHLLLIRIYHQLEKSVQQLDVKDQEIYRANPQFRSEILTRYRKLMLIMENAQHFQHKIRSRKRIDVYQKEIYKRMKKKIQQKRKQVNKYQQISPKKQFQNQTAYRKQLMIELGQPKLESYNSEVFSKNLKIVIQKNMQTPIKEEVIVRNASRKKIDNQSTARKRKSSIFLTSFEDQLVPLTEDEIVYVEGALDEYSKINQTFIKNVRNNKDSVPVVKLQLALDEKELRPDGLSEHDEW